MILSNRELDISKTENSFHNIYFISIRNDIITLLKKINSSFENSSSTYYLSLFYVDNIFNLPDFNEYLKKYYKYEYQTKKIYIILSVCCLIISTKFNENDPHFPGAYNFLGLCNKFTNNNYIIQINDLTEGEIIILKFLKYKLNYYSVYNFLVFFFGHGIIADNSFEKYKNHNNYDKKQILEKIYILSREILDLLNNDCSKENIELLNKNNYITAAIILNYSIENILGIVLDNNNIKESNAFMEYYNIKLDNKIKESISNIIKNIYANRDSNKINNEKNKKNKTFRYTYSTLLLNNKKKQFNNYLNNNYQKEKNNYIINTITYYQSPDYNNIQKIDNSHRYFYNNKKIYLNYGKNDELNNNKKNNNKKNNNELKKSYSMNHLQNKKLSADNNHNFQIRNNYLKEDNTYNYNYNSNYNYLNINKNYSNNKNIFIEDKDINNYLSNEIINNNKSSNNKYISLKKNISFKEQKGPSLNKNQYYYDNNKIKSNNNNYYLQNIISTPNEPLTTTNNKRLKLIHKNVGFSFNNNFNIKKNINNSKSKTKEKASLYDDVIEKTKKIFNMNDKNTIIINNNININNFVDKTKYNDNYYQRTKNHNLSNNNYYYDLNLNKINNIMNFNNKKDANRKKNFNYNRNFNNGGFDNFNNNLKSNRAIDILKRNNNYINTYYDYSKNLNNNYNINKDHLKSYRNYNYYVQSKYNNNNN